VYLFSHLKGMIFSFVIWAGDETDSGLFESIETAFLRIKERNLKMFGSATLAYKMFSVVNILTKEI
jgi:hypothetical protein